MFLPVQSGEMNAYTLSTLPWRMEAELLKDFLLEKKKPNTYKKTQNNKPPLNSRKS